MDILQTLQCFQLDCKFRWQSSKENAAVPHVDSDAHDGLVDALKVMKKR